MQRLLPLIVVLSLPAVLTVVLPDWMYPAAGVVDAWVYNGFFRHLEPYAATLFPDTYYGTRLGWIMPGFFAHRWLTPESANFVLHAICYVVAVAAVYGIVAATAGRMPALLAAVCFGLYLPVIRALGDDYVDTAVVVYVLLATLAVVRAVKASRLGAGGVASGGLLALLAGAAAAAMLHSNAGSALLLPSILVWGTPLSLDRERWRDALRLAWYFALGGLLCTLLLAQFSLTHGGPWAFFAATFSWAGGVKGNPWEVTGVSWIATSPWSYLPFAIAAATLLLVLVPSRRAAMEEWQVRALAAFGVTFLIFAAWDFIGPGANFSLPFYTSWLYPSIFVLVGSVLFAHVRPTLDAYVLLLLASAALLASIAWAPLPNLEGRTLAVLAVCLALAVLAVVRRPAAAPVFAVTLMLLAVHAASPSFGPQPMRADLFRTVDEGVRFVDRFDSARPPRFVFTGEPALYPYMDAITGVYLWEYSTVSTTFPAVTEGQAALVTPGSLVIVMAGDEAQSAAFDAAFAPYGLTGHLLATERVDTARGPIYFTALQAVKPQAPDASADPGSTAATAGSRGSAGRG